MSAVVQDNAVMQGLAPPLDWQARLRRGLLARPDHDIDSIRAGRWPPAVAARVRAHRAPQLRAAAVLVPIVQHAEGPTLLLTQRAADLRQHAGQISFPGGRVEPEDLDPTAAALRETYEETGIAADFIEPLGFLPDLAVISGYRITPLVAILRPGFIARPHVIEVAQIFELPLTVALARNNYVTRVRRVDELEFTTWALPFGERLIWGATAIVLRELCAVLLGAPLDGPVTAQADH